uniref:hypothetical protein n=1 Tax=Dubosiella newyorkensis TaxID=1862672 RepID=UPI00248CC740
LFYLGNKSTYLHKIFYTLYPRDKYCGLLYYEWEQLLENDKKECIKLKEKKENIAIEFQGELLLEVIENE